MNEGKTMSHLHQAKVLNSQQPLVFRVLETKTFRRKNAKLFKEFTICEALTYRNVRWQWQSNERLMSVVHYN